jgi:HD-GYP domain-containing protein (c-di-GMP phosphodiesterase class II)
VNAQAQRVPLQSVGDLMVPGEPLPFRVLDAEGRLLLAQGQRVMDVRQLQALLQRGASVVFEEAQAVREARAKAPGPGAGPTLSTRKLTWFDRWERHVWDIDDTLRNLSRGAGNLPALNELIDRQMALVTSQPDAAIFTLLRQDDRRFALYALVHARFTAMAVQLTAAVLGWTPEQVRSAVAAALTMNVSMVELQARMAEQADPPTKKQLDQIRAHPALSLEMLKDAGVDDQAWLTAVADHHEQQGGTGYPRAIESPGDVPRLVRACDVFTAKISPRALRPPLLSQVAARQLFQEEKGGALAGALIKAMGVYPPGDLVKLKNGEGGVVVRRVGAALEVAVLLGASGKPVLGGPRRNTGDPELGIVGPLQERAGLPRVLPEQVFGLLYG